MQQVATQQPNWHNYIPISRDNRLKVVIVVAIRTSVTRVYSDSMEEKSADSKSGNLNRGKRPWRCSGCKTRRKQCPRNCVQMYTMNSKKDFERLWNLFRRIKKSYMDGTCFLVQLFLGGLKLNDNQWESYFFGNSKSPRFLFISLTIRKIQERKLIGQNNPRFSCLFFGKNKEIELCKGI